MQKIGLEKLDILIIVDMQNDFMPDGALPVPDSDKIIAVINRYIQLFKSRSLSIVASRDWHPPNHCSFKKNGGTWPVHCVAGTKGAEFPSQLYLPEDAIIVSKATDPKEDAYSALKDTNLLDILKKKNIKRCFVGGVATDYCVLYTVLDLLKEGYEVYLLQDAIKGVDKEDSERAIKQMKQDGAKIIRMEMIK